MTQTGARAAQIMRSQSLDSSDLSTLADDPPDQLFTDSWPPDLPGAAHPAKHRALNDCSSVQPPIQSRLYPEWDRDGPDMSTLSIEIDDSPVFISLLKVTKSESRQLCPAKATTKQK
jgi:hypothetical protein